MSDLQTASWQALGTTAAVVVSDPRSLNTARACVEAELEAIDLACSRFREDSDLSRVNDGAGRAVPVGPLLLEAIAVAVRAAQLTDGAVDPTIGAALVLAGYDRDFSTAMVEPEGPIAVRRVPGWRAISVDTERGRLTIPRGVRLDLGATAKALAADRAASTAFAATGGGVLVNLGGDIAVAGSAPAGGWPLFVTDDHRAPAGNGGQWLTIHDGGLATSSTTVRRWGRSSHHIVDPRSGRPARSRWQTVSVAAGSCVDANTASTAAIVRGDDALEWLEHRGLPARLVAHSGAVSTVAAWPSESLAA